MSDQKACVAITGATGFIGRSALDLLVSRHYSVKALCRRPTQKQNVNFVKGDLNDSRALLSIAETADTFIHIAGLTKARNLTQLLDVNEHGAVNAAKAALDAKVRLFILVSSIAAREPHLSDYAKSKRAGEESVRKTLEGSATELLIIRPTAILGPGDDATAPMMNILKRGFLPAPAGVARKNGRMSFVYVDDIARFIVDQIAAPKSAPILTPHGATRETSWQELADSAANILSKPVRVIPISPWILKLAAGVNQTLSTIFSRADHFNTGKVRELLHSDWTGEIEIENAYTLEQTLRHAFELGAQK